MTAQTLPRRRTAGALLTAGIVILAATTGYIHLTLGGLLFLLAGLGYGGLIVLVVLGAIAPHPLIARFDWFPRVALIGYTTMTIIGYLVMGPYFALGWITKAVEVALVTLVVVDVIRVYGSPRALVRRAIASIVGSRVPVSAAQPGAVSQAEMPNAQADAPQRA